MVVKTGVGVITGWSEKWGWGNNGVVGKTVVGLITGWSEKRGWG